MRCYQLRVWEILPFFLILFLTLGCGISKEEYAAKVNDAKQYKELAEKRETEIKTLQASKKALDEELNKTKQEKKVLDDKVKNQEQTLAQEKAEQMKAIEDAKAQMEAEIQQKSQAVAQSAIDVVKERSDLESQINAAHHANMLLKKESKEKETMIEELNQDIETLTQQMDQIAREKEIKNLESEQSQANPAIVAIEENLAALLGAEMSKDEVRIQNEKERIVIRLPQRKIFNSAHAYIMSSGFKILDKVASALNKMPNTRVQISGHTDNQPVGSELRSKYPTNWELSTARAVSVLRYLVDNLHMDASRISAVGYGSQHPIASNKTPKGREKNRRVEFVILPN